MCPPLSCCHRLGASPLRRQLYYLLRLLLASGAGELQPGAESKLQERIGSLWESLQHAVQQYYRVPAARAFDLTSQVVHALLREDCCRESVRQHIALADALTGSEPMRRLEAAVPATWPLRARSVA